MCEATYYDLKMAEYASIALAKLLDNKYEPFAVTTDKDGRTIIWLKFVIKV
jgi:hypothetical protein